MPVEASDEVEEIVEEKEELNTTDLGAIMDRYHEAVGR